MHLGLVGYGNIAASLVGLLEGLPVTRITVLARPGSEAAARQRVGSGVGTAPVDVVASLEDMLDAGPGLVVECAGHSAVAAYGASILGRGTDLVVASVGALAAPEVEDALTSAAAEPGAGRLILPIGAIGGLDLLSTLAEAGGLEVAYTGRKPPGAWKGSEAEKAVDLDGLDAATTFFSGTARGAARSYPKNANVVAALALAGAGFEATRVDLVADPGAEGNTHSYEVRSPLCSYSMRILAAPSPDNPRTSATTVWSILHEVRKAAERRGRG